MTVLIIQSQATNTTTHRGCDVPLSTWLNMKGSLKHIWLVVSTPLKKNISQLGLLFPIYILENKKCSKPPTRYGTIESRNATFHTLQKRFATCTL